jgi:hypothetical protein
MVQMTIDELKEELDKVDHERQIVVAVHYDNTTCSTGSLHHVSRYDNSLYLHIDMMKSEPQRMDPCGDF